jgi:hypothetical protein
MKISLQKAIEKIDGINAPFIIEFVKADGSIRQMVAVKRNRMRNQDNTAVARTKFKYSLRENNLLLIQELATYQTETKKIKGRGTVHQLVNCPTIDQINLASVPDHRRIDKSIKINTIIKFNHHTVWA